MNNESRLFPEQASSVAGKVDALTIYVSVVSVAFAALIFGLVVYFAVRYRRAVHSRSAPIAGNLMLELVWTAVPLFLALTMFAWGAKLYLVHATPPDDALEMLVVGKQWMWKVQHMEGRREINELHVPVGRPVKLTLASEDVIHSFYVPAFRIKQDVLPGRYTNVWFEPTRAGQYHLFCAEYCGTMHSQMVGRVVVMEPAEYSRWLGGDPGAETPAAAGATLFARMQCHTCHSPSSGSRGPDLRTLYGSDVRLRGGETVRADENYLRESIVSPGLRIVDGFEPIMPVNYRELLGEEGVLQLVAYLKSLAPRREDGEGDGEQK